MLLKAEIREEGAEQHERTDLFVGGATLSAIITKINTDYPNSEIIILKNMEADQNATYIVA